MTRGRAPARRRERNSDDHRRGEQSPQLTRSNTCWKVDDARSAHELLRHFARHRHSRVPAPTIQVTRIIMKNARPLMPKLERLISIALSVNSLDCTQSITRDKSCAQRHSPASRHWRKSGRSDWPKLPAVAAFLAAGQSTNISKSTSGRPASSAPSLRSIAAR